MNAVQIGSALRRIRVRLGLRQADVAARARMPRGVVSRIERGDLDDVPLGRLRAAASVLEAGVNLDLRWRGGELHDC